MEKAATTASVSLLFLLLQSADAFLPMAPADISLRFVPGCSPKVLRNGAVHASRGLTAANMGVELFGSQGSRSPLVNWYLHELDTPFEMAPLDRNPHPFGQIPCLKDGKVEIFESGAILLYLAHKYGGLASPEDMAQVTKWVMWANAALDPILFLENERGQVIGTRLTQNPPPKGIQVLETLLSDGRQWICGDDFSVADVAIGAYLLYMPQFFPDLNMGSWPAISKYMLCCAKRPAYAKAYEREHIYIVDRIKLYYPPDSDGKKTFGFNLFR